MNKITLALVAIAALFNVAVADNFTDEEIATTLSAKEVEVMPVPVEQDQPNVPPSLRGEAGRVYVAFIVDQGGKVVAPRVLKTENDKLNEVAVACVSKWSFKAAKKDGAEVAMRVIVPIRFG
jgi:TonB family protein